MHVNNNSPTKEYGAPLKFNGEENEECLDVDNFVSEVLPLAKGEGVNHYYTVRHSSIQFQFKFKII